MILKKLTFLVFCIALLLNSCGNRTNENPAQLLAGASSKTWHPVKETNAAGNKEKLSSAEKNESWVFYSNGTMSMNLSNQAIQGRWSYNESGKTLIVTPDGSTNALSFNVVKLDNDDLHLRGGDGSEMKLESK